eukprot:scaffold15032_cov45-Isochrysis_galbana.AAC.1
MSVGGVQREAGGCGVEGGAAQADVDARQPGIHNERARVQGARRRARVKVDRGEEQGGEVGVARASG